MVKKIVSIILVARNAEQYIRNCMDSISQQKTAELEFIVIDGNSSDRTVSIINEYNSYVDVVISESDTGIYDAMNKGVSVANGMWLYFIGADDILLPGAITEVLARLKDCRTVYYGNVVSDQWAKGYAGRFNVYKLMNKNICHQSIFYPIQIFVFYKYSLKYRILADYYLNIQLYCDKRFRFEYMDILVAYYGGNGTSSRESDEAFIKDRLLIYKNHVSRLPYFAYRLKRIIVNGLS